MELCAISGCQRACVHGFNTCLHHIDSCVARTVDGERPGIPQQEIKIPKERAELYVSSMLDEVKQYRSSVVIM